MVQEMPQVAQICPMVLEVPQIVQVYPVNNNSRKMAYNKAKIGCENEQKMIQTLLV
jgi:hypothetical protein